MNLSRLREVNRRQTQILCSVCFGCFVFNEVLHEWQSLANGRDGGCHLFYLFSWPLILFTRGRLPLGQQYPPLNRKPSSGFRFLISPDPFGLGCLDDTGHRDVTSCKARDFVQFRKWRW